MGNRRKELESKIGAFLKQYARKHKNTPDPNDRTYDRRVEEQICRLSPQELDTLIHGLDGDDLPMEYDTALTECLDRIKQFDPSELLRALELLAHNLTISVRAVWTDTSLSADERLELIAAINEIQHRVTARIPWVRLGRDEWEDDNFSNMVRTYTEQQPKIAPHVAAALRCTCDALSSE